VKFEISVNGNADKPGKGLAFWYTSNIMAPGILFGSEERYEGNPGIPDPGIPDSTLLTPVT